jgi:hypothetical protein
LTTTTTTTVRPESIRRPRDARRFRRIAAAAILPVPALCIAAGRPLLPPGVFDDTARMLDGIASRGGASQVAVWLSAVSMLLMVPALLAASRLARRRRPRMATAAAAVNLAAYLGAGLGFTAFDAFLVVASQPGTDRAGVLPAIQAYQEGGVYSLSAGLFVVGHVLGMVLLGLALRGSVPRWASTAITVSQPLHFVCFVILQRFWLDAAAWGLAAAGLAACAVTVLRTPDDEWDLPPLPR